MTQQESAQATIDSAEEATKRQQQKRRSFESDEHEFVTEYVVCRRPRIIDWDAYDLQRNTPVVHQPPRSLRCGTTFPLGDLTIR